MARITVSAGLITDALPLDAFAPLFADAQSKVEIKSVRYDFSSGTFEFEIAGACVPDVPKVYGECHVETKDGVRTSRLEFKPARKLEVTAPA